MENLEEKTNDEENTFKLDKNLAIVIGIAIIAFAYIYVENNKIQYKEKIRLQDDLRQERLQEKYEDCIDNTYEGYLSEWNDHCKMLKMKDECALPRDYSNLLEKRKNHKEQKCMEEYKNSMR